MDRLTVPEYLLLMEAVKLKQLDKRQDIHLLAWLTFAAKATKGKGKHIKPVYDKFKRFFNYEEELEKLQNSAGGTSAEGSQPRFAGIGKLFKKGE